MDFVVIFDTNEGLDEVRQELDKTGFYDGWGNLGVSYHLPHNCMWKKQDDKVTKQNTAATVLNDLNEAVKQANSKRSNSAVIKNNIHLTRAVVLELKNWRAIEGQQYKS